MGERKAAYIATIDKIEDIEGKDRIKYISLKNLGWQVIGSADLKIGDKVIYVEYDTIVQEGQEWAEFLRKRCYAPKYHGFKIRAMSMAGKISYGLILSFKDVGRLSENMHQLSDGTDLSELLHISPIDDAAEFENKQNNNQKMTKWQKFVKKYAYFIWKFFYYRKPQSSQFPSEVAIKTDETRIQTLNYIFRDYQSIPIYVTEKLDGQSATFSVFKNRFIVSSRNVKQYDQPIKKACRELRPGNALHFGKASAFVEIACIYDLPQKMVDFIKTYDCDDCLTIQGELCGPGIQGNKLKLTTNKLFIFNLFNPKIRKYYNWDEINKFCVLYSVPSVPFKEFTFMKWANIPEMENYVKESFVDSIYPEGQPREGLVFRKYNPGEKYLPEAEREQNGCFSWKCINPEFILSS
jgi:hypothetical protein